MMISAYIIQYFPVILSAIVAGITGGIIVALKKVFSDKIEKLIHAKDNKLEELKSVNAQLINMYYNAKKENEDLSKKLNKLCNAYETHSEVIKTEIDVLDEAVKLIDARSKKIEQQYLEVQALLRSEDDRDDEEIQE